MTIRRRIIGVLLAAIVGSSAWFAYAHITAPELPEIALDGADPQLIEAIERGREDVRQHPRSGRAWGELGSILAANRFHEPAAVCFTHAARFDSSNPHWPYLHAGQYIQTGRSRDAIPYLRTACSLAVNRNERIAVHFTLGIILIEEGELEEAARVERALAAVEPDGAAVTYLRGLHAIARGDTAGAREYLSILITHPSARKRVARLLANLTEGDRERSRDYLAQSAALPPDQPWPDPIRGELRRYRINREERLELYREFERNGQRAEARLYLKQLVAESPDAETCHALGLALFTDKDYAPAHDALRKAVQFDANNAKSQLYLGAALLELANAKSREPNGTPAALEMYRQVVAAEDRALAIQVNLALAHGTRARALQKLGRTDESIQALRQAAQSQPNSADAHLELGEALAEAGRVAEAIGPLEDAVRLAKPDDPRPRAALAKWLPKAKP